MRKIGIYVDASNIGMNGGRGMRYDCLRQIACRGNSEAQRLNSYVAFDEDRASKDPAYATKAKAYQAILREQGFRVNVKPVRRYKCESGEDILKSNADLELAVDALSEAARLDTIMLVTGDGDFVQVVRALQSQGVRVEVLAFDNVSSALREASDLFINGFLMPDLVPIADDKRTKADWGQVGGRTRGLCHTFTQDASGGWGFLHYYPAIPEDRLLTSKIASNAYFKGSSVNQAVMLDRLPSRRLVLEFTLQASNRPGGNLVATDLEVVSSW